MAIICWGNLAKSADDTTRVEQSIHHYVQTHDENPNAHMGADYSLGGHRLQVELDHPPNSVNYFHVKDIHAESITAGGLVVKGKGPYILVQDEAGDERVKIYPEGIIVKKGLISVQNEGEQVIIDKKGLWGSNISYTGQQTSSSQQRVGPGDMWYNLTELKFGVYVSRASPILVWSNVTWQKSIVDTSASVRLYYPTGYMPTVLGTQLGFIQVVAGNNYTAFSMLQMFKLIPGFNLVQLQAYNKSDSVLWIQGTNQRSNIGYMVLGN